MVYTHTHTHTHTEWNTTQSQKEQNFVICSDIDGLVGHYTKWNKSGRERQILYDFTYMWILKKIQQTSEYTKKEADSQGTNQ